MIQNLLRSCLVCSITLFTFGIAEEVLKSSEFEDKEIPFLLNWKGEKHEKNHNIDGNWWRWVQEENGKTITEETAQNPAAKNGHTLLFKRSIQPFRPNIDPLRSLFNSEVQHDHKNQKRWISSSFGFGNKKKSRKDSKQPLADVRKSCLAHSTPSPKVAQRVWDDTQRDPMNGVPQDLYIRPENNVLNSTHRMGWVNNFGQSLDLAGHPKDLSPTQKQISTRSYTTDDRPTDDGNGRKLQNYRILQLSQSQEQSQKLKLQPTRKLGYATAGMMTYGDFYWTRKISVDPKVWARYTTETIFDRVFEPYTELRFNPFKMKFPFEELSRTSKQFTARPTMNVAIEGGTISSPYAAPFRSQEHSRPQQYPKNCSSNDKNADDIKEYDSFSAPEKDVRAAETDRNLDVFDQISIPSVSNSDTLVQLHQMEKTRKNVHGTRNMNKIRYKDGDVVNNVVPSLKTQNNFKRKQIVTSDEGANYDYMPPEEEDSYENDSLSLLPTKLQPKANKNLTRNMTVGRHPVTASGKCFNSYCGAGGSCGNCGGGVNISIMMHSPPAFGPTVDNSAAQISHSTRASDKNKKKKERKKKPNKNSENSLSESVISGKKDKGNVNTQKVSAYRRNNDTMMFANRFRPTSEQQRTPHNKFGYPYDSNESSKTQYRGIVSASGRIFESAKHNMPNDSPNNNFSCWNYLNIVHQMQHPIPPTVYGIQHTIPPTVFGMHTVGGPSEDQDDEDELKELYDEQNNTKMEDNMKSSTMPYSSNSKSTLPDYAKNFLFGKNSHINDVERIGVLEKLKNNNSGSKPSGQGKDIKYPSLNKKNKDSYAKEDKNLDDLCEPWEKYSFPRQLNSDNGYGPEQKKLYEVENSKINHHQLFRSRSYTPQRNQEYLLPNEEVQESEYYDQWEALDADLKNDLTGGGQEDLRVQVRNRKREVGNEESVDDAQGYYRLSSGSSLRNPTNMIISAFRKGKMNRDKKPLIYEEFPAEGDAVSVKPTPVTNTPN